MDGPSNFPVPLDPVARFVFDESSDAILCIDLQDRIIYWNRGAEELFGYTEEEVLGHNFSLLVPGPAEREELKEIATRTKLGLVRRYETQRITKDGRRLTIQLTRTILQGPGGNPIGFAALVRDVTPIKELTAQVAKMERLSAMTKITASVAHEIRTPLSVLGLTSDMLHDAIKRILAAPDSDTTRQEACKIRTLADDTRKEIIRLNEIVDHYLFLARIRVPQRTETDLNVFITEIASDLRRKVSGRPVEFLYHPSLLSCSVNLDTAQIRHLFYNLLSNALDAMPTGGTITLETQYRNGQMEIRFSDTGTGIAPELAEVIFEPFETSKPTGSGLGLYIVREVVSAHGGEVQIESIPGQGTTVIVVIPASGFYGTEKISSGENLTGSENNG